MNACEQVWKPSQHQVYDIVCRGHKHLVTVCGSTEPSTMYASFLLEQDLRELWWDVEPDQVVLDAGSAYGSYTLSALAAGAKLVLAVDPDRDSFFDLESNLTLNWWRDRCGHFNFALSDVNEILPWYPASHSNRPEGDPEYRLNVTVDRFLENQVDRLDWIKLDVEGMESRILKGAAETLNKFHPRLLIENHPAFVPGIEDQIRAILKPLGYVESHISNDQANGSWSRWTWKDNA